MLIDHKNASVFFQAVSGKSSWSFSYRWTQHQWEKTATKHPFIALLAKEEKTRMFFGYFFVWVPIFDPTLMQYFIQLRHIMFCCPLSALDKWWFEQKKSPLLREKYFVLSYLNVYLMLWQYPGNNAGEFDWGCWKQQLQRLFTIIFSCRPLWHSFFPPPGKGGESKSYYKKKAMAAILACHPGLSTNWWQVSVNSSVCTPILFHVMYDGRIGTDSQPILANRLLNFKKKDLQVPVDCKTIERIYYILVQG